MLPAFRTLLPYLLRQRLRLAFALCMAFVSAAGLGLGVVGLVPVLESLLSQGMEGGVSPIVVRAQQLDERLGGVVPDAWIAQIPTDVFHSIVLVIVVLGLLTLVGATANFLHAAISMTVSLRAVADIRAAAFDRLLRVPMGVSLEGSGADWLSRVINDANALGRGFQALTNKAVAQITKGAAMLVVAFALNWKLAAITLAVVPVLTFVIRKLSKRIRRASKAAMKGQGKLLGVATESLGGLRVVKVHHTEATESARFRTRNEEVYRQQMRARTARALASPLTEVIVFFFLGALALVAIRQILTGELDVTIFIATLGALAVSGQSLKPLNTVVQDLTIAEAAAARIRELLDRPAEQTDAGAPLPRHTESIRFERASLRYAGAEHDALAGVTLEIPFGETVAFVGPNGSGKTSLLSLVPRLYDPTSGAVEIDGIDLRTTQLASLREQLAVVTQETVLFRGSVADNIGYGLASPDRDRIVEAAKEAAAHEFIEKLPEGYDTQLGDGGMTLSGGQRQRIALARAFARNPAILIMDEATSMIDGESEARITQAVRRLAQGRTCLIVAHRLSTVAHASRIVLMEEGRIVDVGTHDALLTSNSLYQDLAQHQLAAAGAPAPPPEAE